MHDMQEILDAIQKLRHEGGRGAMATVIETGGSAPQKPGSRMVLRPDGDLVGTVGGGAVEHRIVDALEACRDGESAHTLDLDLGKLGMSCGGRMKVFIEPLEAPSRLVIFGAGHVGLATAPLASSVGFAVTIVDERAELNCEDRFPGCRRIVAAPKEAVEQLGKPSTKQEAGPAPWFLIMTHDHGLDDAALEACLHSPHEYIGLIGSQRKVFRILRAIGSRSKLPSLERLYAPVGIDLGAQSPNELALSIVAEMVALRHGREATHLRLMDSPLLPRVLGGEIEPDEAVASMGASKTGR